MGYQPQQRAIIILTYALVGERIGGWNVYKKQNTEVEYVVVKTKYFIIVRYNSVFCLINVQALAVYFANVPSQLFREGKLGEPKEEIGNLYAFEFMYLSDFKIPYFLYLSSASIKVISMGTTPPVESWFMVNAKDFGIF
jgi:hypothetical protein